VLKKSLMAALIGSSCGAAAGYWTPPPRAAIGAPAAVEIPDSRAGAVPVDVSTRALSSAPAISAHVSRPPISQPGALDVEFGDAVRRARELALRADVTALVALRAAVVRRAEEAGRKDDPAIRREIQAIDQYLLDARALRLKLDAAAIRKGT
jgi:type II secretory pathway component HofQ